MNKAIFESGVTHYDDPPPDVIDDLDALQRRRPVPLREPAARVDRGRGRPDRRRGLRRRSGGVMGATTVRLATKEATFAARALPDLQRDPEIEGTTARFVQTVGGRTALPAPAPREPPAVRAVQGAARVDDARVVIHADGRSEFSRSRREHVPPALGLRRRRASSRPRPGSPTSRTGTATRSASTRRGATRTRPRSSPRSRPRSSASSPPRSCAAARSRRSARSRRARCSSSRASSAPSCSCCSTACSRSRSTAKPLAELGPGAILGERAVLEGGRRTATLRAVTPVRVAVARARPDRHRTHLARAERGAPARRER